MKQIFFISLRRTHQEYKPRYQDTYLRRYLPTYGRSKNNNNACRDSFYFNLTQLTIYGRVDTYYLTTMSSIWLFPKTIIDRYVPYTHIFFHDNGGANKIKKKCKTENTTCNV